MNWWPNDIDDDMQLEWDDEEITEEIEINEDLNWKEAYEKNKTREYCILCGKPTTTRNLLEGSVRACRCVDELAEKETKKNV